jgi:hypothetical protein
VRAPPINHTTLFSIKRATARENRDAEDGSSKPYDGTTAATVTLSDDAIAGDKISLTYGAASFASAAVGNNKIITVGGLLIAGGAAQGDYVLAKNTATTTGDITLDFSYEENAEDTWGLAPALPRRLVFSDPSPAAAVLDLTLPGSLGGLDTVSEARPATAQ